jgi:hypothetical protein
VNFKEIWLESTLKANQEIEFISLVTKYSIVLKTNDNVVVVTTLKIDFAHRLSKNVGNTTFRRLALSAVKEMWEGGGNLLSWPRSMKPMFIELHAVEPSVRS